MIDHPNFLLIHQSWQAVADSDVDTLKALWSPEIVWHASGENNPHRGDHKGHTAVLDYLARVGESGESYDATLEDVMVGETNAALVAHVKTRRSGIELNTAYLLLARIEGRQIAEVWTLPVEAEKVEAFWKASA